MSSRCIPRWLQLNSWKCTKTLIRITLLALSLLQHKLQNRWKTSPNPIPKPFKNRTKNQTLPTSIFHRFWLHLGAQDDSKIDEKSIPKVSRKINGCWSPSWTDFYRFYPPTWGPRGGPRTKVFGAMLALGAKMAQELSKKASGTDFGAIFNDFRLFFRWFFDPLELLWHGFFLPWTIMIIMKHMCQMNNNEPYESYEPYVNYDEPYETWCLMNHMNHMNRDNWWIIWTMNHDEPYEPYEPCEPCEPWWTIWTI